MSENNKKAFDPSTCFMFFGSWMKSIEAMETDQDRSSNAYRFFKAIAYYSMYDESPDFGDAPILNALWALVEREIDISIGNRKRGFAHDAIGERYQVIIDALINNPSSSLREIASMTGTDKNMVDRVKKKYAKKISDGIANYYDSANAFVNSNDGANDSDDANANVNVNNGVNANDGAIVNDNDSDNDGMGRDRDGTAGQSVFFQKENDIDPLTCSMSDWQSLPDDLKKEFSLLDRIQARLTSPNWSTLEILANEGGNSLGRALSVKGKWNYLYKLWHKSITNDAVNSILDKHLSSHTETEALKRIGDKYGRIIDGWDEETHKPKILYSFTYFHKGTQHNINGIPTDYYMTEQNAAEIAEEQELLKEWISEQEKNFLPLQSSAIYDDGMPF